MDVHDPFPQTPVQRYKPTRPLTEAERERRVCVNCGRKFAMFEVNTSRFQPIGSNEPDRRVHTRGGVLRSFDRAGHFCTLRCAGEFGVSAANQGMRRPKS